MKTPLHACWALAGLAGLLVCARPVAAQQLVVLDETYTATADNTSDSHYRVPPDVGTPDNWRSPVDYAAGSAHVRLEVLAKPSAQKTLYNLCYEATPSYACMPYSPAYTAPGVYDFEYPFSAFYQYDMVDWSQGVNQLALILKDEGGTKKQGDPAFYPTTIHVTLTLLAPGETYVPPALQEDAGTPDAGTIDAGTIDDPLPMPDAAVPADDPAPVIPPPAPSAGTAATTGSAGQAAIDPAMSEAAGSGGTPASAQVTPPLPSSTGSDTSASSAGCAVRARPSASSAPRSASVASCAWACALLGLLSSRARRSRRA
jgi:hypothetical protein